MGLSLKLSILRSMCCRSALRNNVKNITFDISSDSHVDVKASLAKSGEVGLNGDKNGHIKWRESAEGEGSSRQKDHATHVL